MSGAKRTKLFRVLLIFFLVYALLITSFGIFTLLNGLTHTLLVVGIVGAYAPLVATLLFWAFAHDWHRHEDASTGKLRKTLEAEELQSEAVLTALDEGVLIMSRDGVVKYMNPRMEEMMASSEEYMLGKHFSKLVSEQVSIMSSSARKPRLSYNVTRVFETGLPVQIEQERLLYHKTKTYLDLAISLLPLKNSRGEISALMIVGRDISGLIRRQEKADEFMVKAGVRFAGSLQPALEHIEGLAHASDVGEQSRQKLDQTRTSLSYLKRLTDDVKTYTGLLISDDTRELKFVKVAEVLEKSAARAAEHHVGKYVTVTQEVAISSVIANESRLQLVVDQLVDNAYKFSPDKDTVLVRAVADGTTAVIEVMDNGIGIPEDQRETIFEPFSKEYNAEYQDSTGLGMAICKKIVDDWGGEIKISTQEAGGVVMTCTVPGALQSDDTEDNGEPMAPHIESVMNPSATS